MIKNFMHCIGNVSQSQITNYHVYKFVDVLIIILKFRECWISCFFRIIL